MGTSTNYSGSPNWGPARSATTRVGGKGNITPKKVGSIVSSVVDQMVGASQLGFGSPLSQQRGGGRGGGSGGNGAGTRRVGGPARTIARRIGTFLADVASKGFRDALAEQGLTDLTGMSPDEIALALADLLGGPASLIEETALRGALMELVLEWSNDVQGFEGLDESVTCASLNIERALHDFFGHYIFEVFKTVAYRGVLAAHGFEKAERMAGQIRDFIDAKIGGLEASHLLSSVDWRGTPGMQLVDAIVEDTIDIFGSVQP